MNDGLNYNFMMAFLAGVGSSLMVGIATFGLRISIQFMLSILSGRPPDDDF